MANFWDGKRVVVTGGAGMIGSCLVSLLLEARAEVTVLDDFSRGNTRVVGAQYIFGDAGNEGECRDTLKGAEAVFNLAAEVGGVKFVQANHAWMFERNLRLLSTPLNISAMYGVERFLQTSSACVYGVGLNAPGVEANGWLGEPTAANAGYSWAKRMGERLAVWYAEQAGLHTVIVRPSNAYGLRDYFDHRAHVVPALIRKCVEDEVIVVNGTGVEEREFIYAGDVAAGMMAALERGRPGGIYNLGTGGETRISIRALLGKIQHLTNSIDKPVRWERLFSGGDDQRWSAGQKAATEIGWIYETGLDEGLRSAVEWYVAEIEARGNDNG